jgi:transposase
VSQKARTTFVLDHPSEILADDPLYRARRVLLMGEEKLDAEATERLWSLLELGDPGTEVAIAYRIKERLRDFYGTRDPDEARALLE